MTADISTIRTGQGKGEYFYEDNEGLYISNKSLIWNGLDYSICNPCEQCIIKLLNLNTFIDRFYYYEVTFSKNDNHIDSGSSKCTQYNCVQYEL